MSLITSRAHAGRNEAILYSHAVLGCLVWAFIVPIGGVLLRLNLKSRWILRIHGILQATAFIAYIAAVGLGAWMCDNFGSKYYNMWDDPHVQLGLAILGLAFFLPPLGYIHHVISKKRAAATAAGLPSRPPGRTWLGTTHFWTGRVLIILGMINGGLGIRMTEKSPYQERRILRKAAIGYGVGCGVVAIVYCAIVVPWEIRKYQQERQKPHSNMRQARREFRSKVHQEKADPAKSSGNTSSIDIELEGSERSHIGHDVLGQRVG